MKRGAPHSPAPARANSYAGSGVSADVKEHTARLAVALQAQGVAVETIMKALADTAYAPKRLIFGKTYKFDSHKFDSQIRPAKQALHFYKHQLQSYRRAVDWWTLVGIRNGVVAKMVV
jgi:hypothetical protein